MRTLPAALAPVIIGAAAAGYLGAFSLSRSMMACAVAVFLQVGVNYSNDYSDGIRGTDDYRVGPPRLTASGMVAPRIVLAVALVFFAAAGVIGLVLVALSGTWWLIGAGAAAIVAAWFYTGGKHPYGYMGVGLSELLVFLFFGLMATVGTTYVQALSAPWWVWLLASGVGAISVALLMVNNTRDIATDVVAGKRTLAVRVGNRVSRVIYQVLLALAVLAYVIVIGSLALSWLWIIPVALFFAVLVQRMVRADGRSQFLSLLRDTGLFAVLYAACVCAALFMPLF